MSGAPRGAGGGAGSPPWEEGPRGGAPSPARGSRGAGRERWVAGRLPGSAAGGVALRCSGGLRAAVAGGRARRVVQRWAVQPARRGGRGRGSRLARLLRAALCPARPRVDGRGRRASPASAERRAPAVPASPAGGAVQPWLLAALDSETARRGQKAPWGPVRLHSCPGHGWRGSCSASEGPPRCAGSVWGQVEAVRTA